MNKATTSSETQYRGSLARFVRRLRDSVHTNETQRDAAIMLTLMNLMACASRLGCPWWLWLSAGVFWPAVAWIGNLISPIRRGTPNEKLTQDARP